MRVAVTGGAGFIGSHVVDLLLERGHEVFVLDNLDPQVHPTGEWPDYLPSSDKLYLARGSITDQDDIREFVSTADPDVCIHLAAKVGVGQSATDPGVYAEVNAGGTGHVLQALAGCGRLKRLVVASSMSCYGEGAYVEPQWLAKHSLWQACGDLTMGKSVEVRPELRNEADMAAGEWGFRRPIVPVPTSEHCALHPTSIYAETKATTERMSLIWGKQQGIPTAALRFFNVYGPRQALSNPYTGVAAIFASAMLRGEQAIIYEDGLQARDFVHVKDVAAAVVLMATNEAHGPVNIGTGSKTTIGELADGLHQRLGGPKPHVSGQFRTGDIRYCLAATRLIESLGWRPMIRLVDGSGLDALAEWARSLPAEATKVTSNPHAELEKRGLLLGGSHED